MRAGDLRHLVALQQHDGTQAASGQVDFSTGWSTTLDNVPASIKATGGAENRGDDSTYDYDIVFRYHDDVSGFGPTWRIVTQRHGTLQPVSVSIVENGGVEWFNVKARK